MRNGVSGQSSAGMVGSKAQELIVTVQVARARTDFTSEIRKM